MINPGLLDLPTIDSFSVRISSQLSHRITKMALISTTCVLNDLFTKIRGVYFQNSSNQETLRGGGRMRLLKLMIFCCVNQEKYDSRNKYIPAQYSFEHYSALYFCLKLMHPNLQFSLKFVIKHVHCTCWNTGPIPVHCTWYFPRATVVNKIKFRREKIFL